MNKRPFPWIFWLGTCLVMIWVCFEHAKIDKRTREAATERYYQGYSDGYDECRAQTADKQGELVPMKCKWNRDTNALDCQL